MVRKADVDLKEEMRAVARGQGRASPLPAARLLGALSRQALELLSVLLRENPATATEVLALTGRAQSNVSLRCSYWRNIVGFGTFAKAERLARRPSRQLCRLISEPASMKRRRT